MNWKYIVDTIWKDIADAIFKIVVISAQKFIYPLMKK